jgi:hypothetical protein
MYHSPYVLVLDLAALFLLLKEIAYLHLLNSAQGYPDRVAVMIGCS